MSSSKSASGSAQPPPASRPRIPETFIEVPDQRRYAVSLGVLCLVCDPLSPTPCIRILPMTTSILALNACGNPVFSGHGLIYERRWWSIMHTQLTLSHRRQRRRSIYCAIGSGQVTNHLASLASGCSWTSYTAPCSHGSAYLG